MLRGLLGGGSARSRPGGLPNLQVIRLLESGTGNRINNDRTRRLIRRTLVRRRAFDGRFRRMYTLITSRLRAVRRLVSWNSWCRYVAMGMLGPLG